MGALEQRKILPLPGIKTWPPVLKPLLYRLSYPSSQYLISKKEINYIYLDGDLHIILT
jgi:hypothetical protein